ncbi:HTH-type transcriptional regulator DmlR [compost metagenome]
MYCASPAYLEARGVPARPEQLAGHDCLPYGHSRQVQWQFSQGGKAQAIQVAGRMRANNGELLRDAAIGGMGVTYLPTFIVGQALADGRLVTVLDEWRPPALQLSAVYPQHRQVARPVQGFVNFLRERLMQL